MKNAYDVVVIGGGVTGGSTACWLGLQDDFDGSVLVVERDPTYQHAPSARSTGGFRQQFSIVENVRIGLFGAHFVKNAERYLAVDGETPALSWREQGYLLLATEAVLPTMQANNAVQRAEGADIHFQTPEQLRARFPWLSTDGLAGGFLGLSNEGWVDPWSLLQAYKRKARATGAEYVADEVVGLDLDGERITHVRLASGARVACGTVVNAAGASGARRVAAMAGVALPIESRKRCTFVMECREDLSKAPLTILPEGVAFRPEGRGFIINRAPFPEADPDTDSVEVDHEQFEEHIWPVVAERVPAFEAVKVVQSWACSYDFNTLDENLILGALPGVANLLVATGFSGHGLQQSPAVGRALSELIVHGEFRALDLSRFSYDRVLRGEALRETNCY